MVTEIKQVSMDWTGCDRCPLKNIRDRVVHYKGENNPDILFIGEMPTYIDNLTGIPLSGNVGSLFDNLLSDANNELPEGKDRPDWSWGVVLAIGCLSVNTKGNLTPPPKEAKTECKNRLEQMIQAINPSAICILGKSVNKYYKMQKTIAHLPVLHLQHPYDILKKGGLDSVEYKKNLIYLTEFLYELKVGTQYYG